MVVQGLNFQSARRSRAKVTGAVRFTVDVKLPGMRHARSRRRTSMDRPQPARTSPILGTAKLTPEQEQLLTAGLYYVNVHTKNNPGGPIRGQLAEAK